MMHNRFNQFDEKSLLGLELPEIVLIYDEYQAVADTKAVKSVSDILHALSGQEHKAYLYFGTYLQLAVYRLFIKKGIIKENRFELIVGGRPVKIDKDGRFPDYIPDEIDIATDLFLELW